MLLGFASPQYTAKGCRTFWGKDGRKAESKNLRCFSTVPQRNSFIQGVQDLQIGSSLDIDSQAKILITTIQWSLLKICDFFSLQRSNRNLAGFLSISFFFF